MEKIACICAMRDIWRAMNELEGDLQTTYGLSLNEAMTLCAIGDETVPPSVISERTGLTPSHTSKVLRSAENKRLLVRRLGRKDRRQMFFTLTAPAKECLRRIRENGVTVPEVLRPIFQNQYVADSGACPEPDGQ